MTHGSQLTSRTHQGILREEVAWLGTELTAYYVLIETGITIDTYVAQVSLRSLCHAHLKVDGIAVDVHFGRIDVREHVTIVVIEVAHSIFIFLQSLAQEFLVIYIALLHAEHGIQIVGSIYGVAHPVDIADKVALTLIYLDIYVDVLLVEVAYAVFQDLRITITILVVFVDEFLLVFLPSLRSKLLRFEESSKLASLVGLGKGSLREESTLDLSIRELLVTVDGNLVNLDFLFLIYDYVQDYLTLVSHIVALVNLDFSILEALVIEVFLGKDLGTVEHVRCYLRTLDHTELLLHILTLAFLQSHVVDIRDTRSYREIDVKIKFFTHDRVGSDSDFREKSMFPIALDGIGNSVAWHFNLFSHCQARDTSEHIVFVSFHTRHIDTSKGQGARGSGIRDIWMYYLVLCHNLHTRHDAE